MSTSYKAILFDLDGTLTHSAPDLSEAINRMRDELGVQRIATDDVIAMVGHGVRNLVARATADITAQCPEFNLEFAYQTFARHYHAVNGQQTVEFTGVGEVLHALYDQGYALGVVTNKASEFTLPLLAGFAWSRLLSVVVCGDTLPEKKPHPRPLYYASQQLKVAIEEVLFVGDSMTDARTAQAAGCDCVLLSYGYNEGMAIRDAAHQNGITYPIYDHIQTALAHVLQTQSATSR